ncbi:MAG: zinc ribbon domain-containing protein [Rhodospirillales bacterium]|nr:zinc ribbon domain-containing protein [Rhodospirillales bacterium]MBN8905742.1 zinc ribbon domain-containing protein [Rhodospirillales bacterium]
MPTYDYECATCGPFTESRPMAEFAAPQPCPECGTSSPRMLSVTAIAGAGPEDSPVAAAPRAHPGGCACCAGPRRFAAEAV